jgi:hypothetical protein
MLAVSRVIDHAEDIHRPALQLDRHLPGRQHRRELRLLFEPGVQFTGLGRVLRIEVQLGGAVARASC